jgi:hypothetical protein
LDFSDDKKKEDKNTNLNTNNSENLFNKNEVKKKNKAEEDLIKKLQDEVRINIIYIFI